MNSDMLKVAYLDHELGTIAEQVFLNRKKNEVQVWTLKEHAFEVELVLEELGIPYTSKSGRGSIFYKVEIDTIPKPGFLWRLRHLLF